MTNLNLNLPNRDFENVFSSGPEDLGQTHLVEHEIQLKDSPPNRHLDEWLVTCRMMLRLRSKTVVSVD